MNLSLWNQREMNKATKENFMVLNVPEILIELVNAGDFLLKVQKIV